ncbi:MAG: serine--tRNA ligase [Cyclobacteriaceae bacterium]
MLSVVGIRESFDLYVSGLLKRGIKNSKEILNEVINTDNARKATQQQLDETLSKSNNLAKQIGSLMKEGKKEEANAIKTETTVLKELSKELTDKLSLINQDLQQQLYNIPNIPNEKVPSGLKEENNEIIKQAGEIPKLIAKAKPHWELIKDFDIIDFELGNKVSGAGFPFYKNEGARLSRSLVNFFLNEASNAGYSEVQPPILINEESGYGTGQLPDKEGQMYHIEDTNLYLIPTAEVPITNIFRDTILKETDLPQKLAGYTPCFRREAGSWGAHVRGLNRLHQFDKVEIVQITHPNDSYETLDSMVAHVESIIKKLELPYRILRLCGGDLGFTSAITYDFEVYSAAQEKWLEVSSVSNFENYQANRLKLRFKESDGKKQMAHTLNGSALALPRIMAAILENNQTETGITIPKVLQPLMGIDSITK